MSEAVVTGEDIYQKILELPQEALPDLAEFVEFLRFKADKAEPKRQVETPFRPVLVKLEGLLEGYDFSPEFIAEARREMWGNFPRDIELEMTEDQS